MDISIVKTKVLHVREQEATSATTPEEAKKVCKFTCPHHMCDHQFVTKQGMLIHAGKCELKDVYPLEKILAHEGSPKNARRAPTDSQS